MYNTPPCINKVHVSKFPFSMVSICMTVCCLRKAGLLARIENIAWAQSYHSMGSIQDSMGSFLNSRLLIGWAVFDWKKVVVSLLVSG